MTHLKDLFHGRPLPTFEITREQVESTLARLDKCAEEQELLIPVGFVYDYGYRILYKETDSERVHYLDFKKRGLKAALEVYKHYGSYGCPTLIEETENELKKLTEELESLTTRWEIGQPLPNLQ